jgi:hypothetical protein
MPRKPLPSQGAAKKALARKTVAKPPLTKKPLAAKPGAKRPPRLAVGGKRPSLLRQIGLGTAVIALFVAALPSATVLIFAMLPTMCAFMIDRTAQRYATRCVGILNFAGCWPYLIDLWMTGHDMVSAMQILLSPLAWLVIYGSAAAGWLCYLSFPAVAWALMDVFAGSRIAHLRKAQRRLVADWGDDVAKAPLKMIM